MSVVDYSGVTVVNHREIWKRRENGFVTFHVTKVKTQRNSTKYVVEMWDNNSRYVRCSGTKIRPLFRRGLTYLLNGK